MQSRIEVPDSIYELKRTGHQVYAWFTEIAIPAMDQIIEHTNTTLSQGNHPELRLELLQDTSPWPSLIGFAIEESSQFPIILRQKTLSLKPLKKELVATIHVTTKTISQTRIEQKPILLTNPRVGISTAEGLPLILQYDLEPSIKAWNYL